MSNEAAASKSAIVLGATGFVGSHIVRNLLLKGYRVEGTCRNIKAAQWLKDLVVPGSSLNLHEITLDSTGSKTEEDDKIAKLQRMDIPNVWGHVNLIAHGAGQAVAQLDVNWGVDYEPFKVKRGEVQAVG